MKLPTIPPGLAGKIEKKTARSQAKKKNMLLLLQAYFGSFTLEF